MERPEVTERQMREDEIDLFLAGVEHWRIQDEGRSASRDERSEFTAQVLMRPSPRVHVAEPKKSGGVNVFYVVAIGSILSAAIVSVLLKGF
jgi:hypothetical protein